MPDYKVTEAEHTADLLGRKGSQLARLARRDIEQAMTTEAVRSFLDAAARFDEAAAHHDRLCKQIAREEGLI